MKKAYRFWEGKSERTRPIGRTKCVWEDDTEIDLREIGWAGMDWINVA
jgi:hypothetical protein